MFTILFTLTACGADAPLDTIEAVHSQAGFTLTLPTSPTPAPMTGSEADTLLTLPDLAILLAAPQAESPAAPSPPRRPLTTHPTHAPEPQATLTPPGAVTPNLAPPSTLPACGRSDVHQVLPGDNLTRVARAHGVTLSQLATRNNMSPADLLIAGRLLEIPPTSPGAGASRSNPRCDDVHILTPGESPARVARSAGLSLSLLLRQNHLTFTDTFQVDQPLCLDGSLGIDQWVVRSGQTLSGISEVLRVSQGRLAHENDVSNPDHLREGQVLIVPTHTGGVQ